MERITIQRSLTLVETLRAEMIAAGDRLLLALAVENQFAQAKAGDDAEAIRKQWRECRNIVEQFADDYATAIHGWRTAVQEIASLVPVQRDGRGTSSTFFQQLFYGVQRIGLHR